MFFATYYETPSHKSMMMVAKPAQETFKRYNESGNEGCYATLNLITAVWDM